MKVISSGHSFAYEMSCLTMLFFPGRKVALADELPESDYVYTQLTEHKDTIELIVQVNLSGTQYQDRETLEGGTTQWDCQRALGVLVYKLLSRITGRHPQWGILTGIRPVKLIQRRVGEGMPEEEIRRYFQQECLVSPEKMDLAMATQKMEHQILSRSTPDSFSLYISIPFCPSRCSYCSFVSHSIEKTFRLIDPYVDALCREIDLTAHLAKELGLTLRTVYFGGGTPTAISAEQLGRLTRQVAGSFDLSQVWEYTIEAGRPDTITREKLQVIAQAGVSRISINPQTFNDSVLEYVGRKHTAQDTCRVYEMARGMGFSNINMDLIAGLPTDTREGFEHSIQEVLRLAPENVTVHTLSVKRAADLAACSMDQLAQQAENVTYMVDYAGRALTGSGYGPYYLYRQKNTLDNLENTGYCKPGFEGLYNVYIMDETHTILACGAGAVTKLRQTGGKQIERVFNYKFPYEYLSKFDEIVKRKEQVKDFYERFPIR